MMIRAAIYLTVACAGVLGAIVFAIVSVVFVLKKRRRRAWASAALALVLAACGIASAFQFVTKSYRAVNHFMTEQASNSYDVNTPDTVGNRRGFEHHFGFAPDTGVSQVYYYADQLGADCQYQLSFKCEKAVIDQIIAALGLVEVPGSYSEPDLDPRADFTWWKPDSTSGRTCWAKEKKDEYYWRLWYAEEDGVAFYQEYSL